MGRGLRRLRTASSRLRAAVRPAGTGAVVIGTTGSPKRFPCPASAAFFAAADLARAISASWVCASWRGPSGTGSGGARLARSFRNALKSSLRKESPQIIEMRIADRQILLAQLDPDIEADGRQPFGQSQVVGPGGDLLALLSGIRSTFARIFSTVPPFCGPVCRHSSRRSPGRPECCPMHPPQGQDIPHQVGGSSIPYFSRISSHPTISILPSAPRCL